MDVAGYGALVYTGEEGAGGSCTGDIGCGFRGRGLCGSGIVVAECGD